MKCVVAGCIETSGGKPGEEKWVELVGALIGLCLIGWGIMTLSTAGESCGSHKMSGGDRCTTITGNHSSSTRSQGEQAVNGN